MDRDALLQTLVGAVLGSSNEHRRQCEQQLKVLEQQEGFTAYLLDLLTENDPVVRLAAAIVFRIRVGRNWLSAESKALQPLLILPSEKAIIKTKLIELLLKVHNDHKLRAQLTTSLNTILNNEKWPEIEDIIKSLLSDPSNVDHSYVGLMILFEYANCYRWADLDQNEGANPVLESIATEIFPYVENIAKLLLDQGTLVSDEMLYLTAKIYKYVTYSDIPLYLQNSSTNLGNWCQLHLNIINASLPKVVIELDPSDRSIHPRIKAIKCCFGNMHHMLRAHAGGSNPRKKDITFAKLYVGAFVPDILNNYYKIIERWSSKQIWLSEASIFHLINFFELLLDNDGFNLVKDQLDAIIRLLIIPSLSATDETIELYADDSEEYIRRYLEIGKSWTTADIGADNFIFKLNRKRFADSVNLILAAISEIFNKRSANKSDLEVAKQTEAALRILATISYNLDKPNSPVHGQLDKIVHTFVVPELSQETVSSCPWLTARACELFARSSINFPDQAVLQDVFQGVAFCAQQSEHLPIQIKGFDALGVLVGQPYVAEQIAPQAPQLMSTLLELSKKFESETLNETMSIIVERFPENLEPYANELSANLVEQFLKLASELLESSSTSGASYELADTSRSGTDIDKEYQAAGVLDTLTTLIMSMNQNPQVAANLAVGLKGTLEFILNNAMVQFLADAIEIMELIVDTAKAVPPVIWDLYDTCLESFQTYGHDYFDTFKIFFDEIVNHGFTKEDLKMDSPQVQGLFRVCFEIIDKDADMFDSFVASGAFEVIEMSVLALGERIRPAIPQLLSQIFDVFNKLESSELFDGDTLDHLSVLKIFFSCLYVDAAATLQFLAEKQFLPSFYKLWIKNSDDFRSVHGCKIQILATNAIIFNPAALSCVPKEYISETVDLLMGNLEELPSAIKARDAILSDNGVRTFNEDENEALYYEEIEADDAEFEAMKETPIEGVNAFSTTAQAIMNLQGSDPQRFQAIFEHLGEKQKNFLHELILLEQQQQQHRQQQQQHA